MANIPVILLAAGNSSRLGQPKQLLRWGKQTLIEHQIQSFLQTGEDVIVVLGASADLILPLLQKYSVTVAINHAWESGMAGSVVCGIEALQHNHPTADGVLVALVDQPLVPLSHYQDIISGFQRGKQQIIASTSKEDWLGVPALFDKCYFSELCNLRGEKGAKSLIQKYSGQIKVIECNEIIKDIDTLDAYLDLYQKHFREI